MTLSSHGFKTNTTSGLPIESTRSGHYWLYFPVARGRGAGRGGARTAKPERPSSLSSWCVVLFALFTQSTSTRLTDVDSRRWFNPVQTERFGWICGHLRLNYFYQINNKRHSLQLFVLDTNIEVSVAAIKCPLAQKISIKSRAWFKTSNCTAEGCVLTSFISFVRYAVSLSKFPLASRKLQKLY